MHLDRDRINSPFYHANFPNFPPNIHQNIVNPIILLLTGIVERYYFCYRYFFCYHVFLFVLLYFYVNTTSPSYAHYRNFISFSMPIMETVHLPSPYPPRSLDPPPPVTDFAALLCPSQSLSLIQYRGTRNNHRKASLSSGRITTF